MYLRIIEGNLVYPYSYEKLIESFPDTSFPRSMPIERLNEYAMYNVTGRTPPTYNPETQYVVEVTPVFSIERNRWEQTFEIKEKI